jgi:hypothetical protein
MYFLFLSMAYMHFEVEYNRDKNLQYIVNGNRSISIAVMPVNNSFTEKSDHLYYYGFDRGTPLAFELAFIGNEQHKEIAEAITWYAQRALLLPEMIIMLDRPKILVN